MRDSQESVSTRQTDRQTDRRVGRQNSVSDPYVPLCFAGDTKSNKLFVKHECPGDDKVQNSYFEYDDHDKGYQVISLGSIQIERVSLVDYACKIIKPYL